MQFLLFLLLFNFVCNYLLDRKILYGFCICNTKKWADTIADILHEKNSKVM